MTTVYLALGSNIGDSQKNLYTAVQLLKTLLQDLRQAPVYRSKAIGYTDQPDFFNTVVSGQTDLSPQELLKKVKKIEQNIGRTPTFRWGPREIDIDIIFYGSQTLKGSGLIIPHPNFAERDFVLKPLSDLDPDLIDPISDQTVGQLLKNLPENQKSLLKQVDEKP